MAGVAVFAIAPLAARADSSSVLYEGHDLGLSLRQALDGIQATGGSRSGGLRFSVSGAGEQLEFTEVNGEAIETESASYKSLDFSRAEVRKVSAGEGRYGITVRAETGSVNDHVLASGRQGESDRSSAINYMDFWLLDPDMSRTRHLADLFATLNARQAETASAESSAPPAPGVVPLVHEASIVLPAPHTQAAPEPAEAADDDAKPAASSGKCLLQAGRTSRHGHAQKVMAHWVQGSSTYAAGNGRLSWHIEPLHGTDDHQEIDFSFTNTLPVAATLVARVILTSSTGAQQAEDLALGNVAPHATKGGDELALTPFADASCVTDVDVTVLRACPLSDAGAEDAGRDNILACNEDAATGTKTMDGITYVAGREPKTLSAPRQ